MSQLTTTFLGLIFFLHSPDLFAETTKKTEPVSKTPTQLETIKKKDTPMQKRTHVVMETNQGTVEVELWDDKAPQTVANFLKYAEEKYYDNTIFHRVIDGFMIQGGGFTADMKQKDTHAPIKNEAQTELKNSKGTLAMARTMDINSATSQFFINLVDNEFLNHTGNGPQTFGYAVFGQVTKGMDIVEKIGKVSTGQLGFHQDVPKESVMILSVRKK